jgi:hypothetical protein
VGRVIAVAVALVLAPSVTASGGWLLFAGATEGGVHRLDLGR